MERNRRSRRRAKKTDHITPYVNGIWADERAGHGGDADLHSIICARLQYLESVSPTALADRKLSGAERRQAQRQRERNMLNQRLAAAWLRAGDTTNALKLSACGRRSPNIRMDDGGPVFFASDGHRSISRTQCAVPGCSLDRRPSVRTRNNKIVEIAENIGIERAELVVVTLVFGAPLPGESLNALHKRISDCASILNGGKIKSAPSELRKRLGGKGITILSRLFRATVQDIELFSKKGSWGHLTIVGWYTEHSRRKRRALQRELERYFSLMAPGGKVDRRRVSSSLAQTLDYNGKGFAPSAGLPPHACATDDQLDDLVKIFLRRGRFHWTTGAWTNAKTQRGNRRRSVCSTGEPSRTETAKQRPRPAPKRKEISTPGAAAAHLARRVHVPRLALEDREGNRIRRVDVVPAEDGSVVSPTTAEQVAMPIGTGDPDADVARILQVATGDNRGVAVVAVPGAGKTTVLGDVVGRLCSKRCNVTLATTFGKAATQELASRLARDRCHVQSLHGIGHGICVEVLGAKRLDNDKVPCLIREHLDPDDKGLSHAVSSLVAQAKSNLWLPEESWPADDHPPEVVDCARDVLRANNNELTRIDVADQVYLPLVGRVVGRAGRRLTDIAIDEAQDLSTAQIEFLLQLGRDNTRLHIFGDPNQTIMGFRHGHPRAIAQLVGRTGVEVMPMSFTRRCSRAVVEEAKKWMGTGSQSLQAMPDAPKGEVLFFDEWPSALELLRPGDAVLCRVRHHLRQVSSYLGSMGRRTNWLCSDVHLPSGRERKFDGTAINIGTLHSAKGITANNVLILDVCEPGGELSERERIEATNLRFVGRTRPKKNLYIVDMNR